MLLFWTLCPGHWGRLEWIIYNGDSFIYSYIQYIYMPHRKMARKIYNCWN